MDDERRRLVALYGEEIVAEMERDASAVPWPCRDTMDGRWWCRVHDAPWPLFQNPQRGCDVWAGRTPVEPASGD